MAPRSPGGPDPLGQSTLHNAVKDSSIAVIEKLLNTGADLNARDEVGATALEKAIAYNRDDVARLLIRRGASLELADEQGLTPLLIAASKGNPEVLQSLIDAGANCAVTDKDGTNALHWAISGGKTANVRFFLENYPSLMKGAPGNDYSVLHYAILPGNCEVIDLLLARGAQVNAKTKTGRNPAWYAATQHKHQVLKLLMQFGADVSSPDCSGVCPIHRATGEALDWIIQAGADPNVQDKNGNTPLHTHGNLDDMRKLLDHGADLNIRNNEGKTPYHIAVIMEYKEKMALLEKFGAKWEKIVKPTPAVKETAHPKPESSDKAPNTAPSGGGLVIDDAFATVFEALISGEDALAQTWDGRQFACRSGQIEEPDLNQPDGLSFHFSQSDWKDVTQDATEEVQEDEDRKQILRSRLKDLWEERAEYLRGHYKHWEKCPLTEKALLVLKQIRSLE